MQIRHLFSLAAILLVAIPHFAVQWFAWKVHLFEIPLGNSLLSPPEDYLWKILSWPMFEVIPRRIQHLHFLASLLANSVTWGIAFVAAFRAMRRFGQSVQKRRRKKRAAKAPTGSEVRMSPPTRLERIIELNALLSLKRITEQEYRSMRKAIMREKEPQEDTFRRPLAPTSAVTYFIPTDANGAQHVAWIDKAPSDSRGKREEGAALPGRSTEAPLPARRFVPKAHADLEESTPEEAAHLNSDSRSSRLTGESS